MPSAHLPLLAGGGPEARDWGIPMETDIAFEGRVLARLVLRSGRPLTRLEPTCRLAESRNVHGAVRNPRKDVRDEAATSSGHSEFAWSSSARTASGLLTRW